MLLGILVTIYPQRAATASLRLIANLCGVVFSFKHVEYYFVNVHFHLFSDALSPIRATMGEDSECCDCDHGVCVGRFRDVLCGHHVFASVD